MRKKLLLILSAIFIASAFFAGTAFAAASPITILHVDISSYPKYYLDNPKSVAAANYDGKQLLFVSETTVGQKEKISVYDDGKRYSVPDYDKPITRMDIYLNYLFVLDGKKLHIYDFSDLNNIVGEPFNITSDYITDFSLSGDSLFVLTENNDSDLFIDKFAMSENLMFSLEKSVEYTEYSPKKIAVSSDINKGDILLFWSADNSIYASYYADSVEIHAKRQITSVKQMRYDGEKAYILESGKVTVLNVQVGIDDKISLTDFKEKSFETSGGKLTNGQLYNVSDIYIYGDKLLVTDNFADKVAMFDKTSLEYGDVYASYSYETGRFNAPQNVSFNADTYLVCDTGNDRIQLIRKNAEPLGQLDIYAPEHALIGNDKNIYAVSLDKLYINRQENGIYADFEPISGITGNVRDIQITASGELYVLTEEKLYRAGAADTESFTQIGAISGGLKVHVEDKMQDIYILKSDSYTVYDNQMTEIKTEPLGSAYNDIYVDFSGAVFLLSAGSAGEIIKINEYGQEVVFDLDFELDIENKFTFKNFSADSAGNLLIAFPEAHAVYKIAQAEIGLTTVNTVPDIMLEQNPLEENSDIFSARLVQINGYPSTLFYGFSEEAKSSASYPAGMAYEGDGEIIESGSILLTFYEWEEGYYLAQYQGKLGIILNDNAEVLDISLPQYQTGILLVKTQAYRFPSDAMAGIPDITGFTALLGQGFEVTITGALQPLDGTVWYSITYNLDGTRCSGYIDSVFVAESVPEPQSPYVDAKLITGGTIKLYGESEQNSQILAELPQGASVRVYRYSGEFAEITYLAEDGIQLKGYIMKSSIAVDNSAQRQRTGLILGFSAVGLGVLFIILKKKYFS